MEFDAMRFLPSAMNVKAVKLTQARVTGGSDCDKQEDARVFVENEQMKSSVKLFTKFLMIVDEIGGVVTCVRVGGGRWKASCPRKGANTAILVFFSRAIFPPRKPLSRAARGRLLLLEKYVSFFKFSVFFR